MKKELKDHVHMKLGGADAPEPARFQRKQPLHVVYGGAQIFTSDTPSKLGRLAISTLEEYAGDFASLATALWIKGADNLPNDPEAIRDLEFRFADDPVQTSEKHPDAFFAWNVFQKTIEKLKNDPVEDYRIDFEDGYGFRPDREEDKDAIEASAALANLCSQENGVPLTGFRIKSFQPETRLRAIRTLEIFLGNLLENSSGKLPEGFVVTLPKIKNPVETESLALLLADFESSAGLESHSIGIEILVETPESLDCLKDIVSAGDGRVTSAHFGAYDYTSSYGIAAIHQHLRHGACEFARNVMQSALAGTGVHLSDSVTTEMPVPVHKSEDLSITQIAENRAAVRNAWRKHFNNISHSQMHGFFQSWDLHPAQLVARYAAVYSFFLETVDDQSKRLSGFLEKATRAMTTGNVFDDLASAEGLLNFFKRGLNCGAFSLNEIKTLTGLSKSEIESGSFFEIMRSRNARGAAN